MSQTGAMTSSRSGAGLTDKLRRIGGIDELGVIAALLGICLALTLSTDTFLTENNLVSVLRQSSYIGIMAVGMVFVISMGDIDLSVGALLMLTSVTMSVMFREGYHPAIIIPAGVLLASACGLANGLLAVALRIPTIIVTLGTLSIFRGITNVSTREKILPTPGKHIPVAFTEDFMLVKVAGLEVMPLIIMLVCVLLGWIYLHLLVAGRETYAIGGNEEAARFSGLRVNWIKMRVYLLSGLAAGVAGMVTLGRWGTVSANTATGYELTVVAAAVVGGASLSGGRGTALGALLGTLVIALIENGIYILHLEQEYRLIIIGAAIIIAVALDRFSEYLRERRARTARVR